MDVLEPASTQKRGRRTKRQLAAEEPAVPSAINAQTRSRRNSPSRSVPLSQVQLAPLLTEEGQAEGPDYTVNADAQPAPSVSARLRDAAANVADQVQDTLTSVRHQPWKTTLWQLLMPLAAVLCVLLVSYGTAWLFGASASPPSGLSSLPDVQWRSAMMQEHRRLWQQLNASQAAAEQGQFRLQEALARMQHLEGTFKHAEAQSQQVQADINALSAVVLEAVQNMQREKRSISQVTANLEDAAALVAETVQPRLQALVQHELNRFAADRTGMPDFALHSAGSSVIGHSALLPGTLKGLQALSFRMHSLFPGFSTPMHPEANAFLLSPGNSAGECLPLNGSTGHVDIRLRQRIVVTAVTVEHLPRSLAFDISSAPKDMILAGFADAPYLSERLEERLPRAVHLGEFQYDIQGEPVQTFRTPSSQALDHVRFKVNSNHGNPRYTCLYRLRVHGYALGA